MQCCCHSWVLGPGSLGLLIYIILRVLNTIPSTIVLHRLTAHRGGMTPSDAPLGHRHFQKWTVTFPAYSEYARFFILKSEQSISVEVIKFISSALMIEERNSTLYSSNRIFPSIPWYGFSRFDVREGWCAQKPKAPQSDVSKSLTSLSQQ